MTAPLPDGPAMVAGPAAAQVWLGLVEDPIGL
jgi:hypothetical protein